jgi:hypothetical protein
MRRGALNPFFSKQSILALEPFLHEKMDLLVRGMKRQQSVQEPFDFGAAYMSLALDVVSHYCFGAQECWNCLLTPGFSEEWKAAMIAAFEGTRFARYVPWLVPFLEKNIKWQTMYAVDKIAGLYFKAGQVRCDFISTREAMLTILHSSAPITHSTSSRLSRRHKAHLLLPK